MEQEREKDYLYDVVIIGNGPTGLSAAIYMARARCRVLLMEKEKISGQIIITSGTANYPGAGGASGKELTRSMKEQTQVFEVKLVMTRVLDMDLGRDIKVLHITAGECKVLGIVLATGANPGRFEFKGEKEFQDRDVACYATRDGRFFTGMEALVIDRRFAAVEEGIFLTRCAGKVTLVVRGDDSAHTRTVAGQVKEEGKIEVKFNTEILEAGGEHMVSYARFRNDRTDEEWTHEAGENGGLGTFVFVDYVSNIAWINGKLVCDEQGYLAVNGSREISAEGVYGVEDVCIKNLRQVVTAVSDSAVATISPERHIPSIHRKLGVPALGQGEADTKRLEREMTGGGKTLGKGSRGDGARGEDTRGEDARAENDNNSLSTQIRQQLSGLFPKFQEETVIAAELDDSPLVEEISGFLGELEGLTDRIICKREYTSREEREGRKVGGRLFPAFQLGRQDGKEGNTLFHGVPGGYEFNSLIVALYNVMGPGQPLDEGLRQRLSSISEGISVRVMVSLPCTIYPEAVMAAQRATSLLGYVTAEMVNLVHYPNLEKKYNIMSVPCMMINGSRVYSGKKSLEEVIRLLERN